MNWTRPTPSDLRKAIDAYLAIAYADRPIPKAVQARVTAVSEPTADSVFTQPVFETEKDQPPVRYALRLGNWRYPHMKLMIERAPDGTGHLYKADTHDQHVRPQPGTRDADAFAELQVANQRIAEEIEAAWEKMKLPTFKSYLRLDLARRLNKST